MERSTGLVVANRGEDNGVLEVKGKTMAVGGKLQVLEIRVVPQCETEIEVPDAPTADQLSICSINAHPKDLQAPKSRAPKVELSRMLVEPL